MHIPVLPVVLAALAVVFLIWLEHTIMKIVIFLALAGAAAWLFMKNSWIRRAQSGAVGYTAGLKSDVERAQSAQKTADAAIKQETEGLQKSLQQAEGAGK